MNYIYYFFIILLAGVWGGCKEESKESKPSVSLQEIEKKYPKKFKDSKSNKSPSNQPLNFPNTICGRIVKKIRQCELEKTRKSKKLRKELKKSILSYKKRKFKEKLDKYLQHCQGVILDIPEEELDKCLGLNCVEMDRCLKKTYESKKSSGKNNQ